LERHVGQVITLEQRFDGHVEHVESRFAQHSRDFQQEIMSTQQRNMVDVKSLQQGLDRVEADMRSQVEVVHNKVAGLEQRLERHVGQVITLEQRFDGHVEHVESRFAQHSRDFQQEIMSTQQRNMVDVKSLQQGLDRVEADMRSQVEVAIQGHERTINDLLHHATDHAQTTDQLNRRMRDLEAAIQTNIQDQTSVQEMIKQESMTMYDLRQSLTNQSDQTHQLGLQLHHLDARMDSLARVAQADTARDLTEERLNRAEGDIHHLSLFLRDVETKEANFLDALRAESEQRALQISNLHQHLNQGLTQARTIQELHHEVAVADAAVARAAEEERAAQVRCGTVVPDARFAELKEWVNIELGRLRQQQQEQFQTRPSPPPYPNPKRGQQDGEGHEVPYDRSYDLAVEEKPEEENHEESWFWGSNRGHESAAPAVEENREQGWFWGSSRESDPSEQELLEKRSREGAPYDRSATPAVEAHESYPWHHHHSHRGQIQAAVGPQPAALWGEQETEGQGGGGGGGVGRQEQRPTSPGPQGSKGWSSLRRLFR